MEKVIIIGATSGIGWCVAEILNKKGIAIGIAGRREERLEQFKKTHNGIIETVILDVTSETAENAFYNLVNKLGGIDAVLICAGIGCQNIDLDIDNELAIMTTNVLGFSRMVIMAFNYFKSKGGGHIAVVSSIAGTKGLGVSPAYSATKRFQNTYIQSLAQLASMHKANIIFTDIKPGFVDTDLLKSGHFPMLMKPQFVAQKTVKAMMHKKRSLIIDWRYRLLVYFWKLIPDCIWEKLTIVKTAKSSK